MSEPVDLDRIEARANAATPGPWERTEQGFTSPSRSDFVQAPYHDLAISDADAEFIAHARADVPALVAEVRALRAKVEQQEMVLRTMDQWADVAEICERKSNEYAARSEAAWEATREVERMAYDGQSAVRMVRAALAGDPAS